MNDDSKRENNYDILKAFSVIAVILLHANATYFRATDDEEGLVWFIENIINYFTQFAVPCFLMISGAFMINKKKTNVSIWLSILYKLFLPFLTMTLIWVIVFYLNRNTHNMWEELIKPLLLCNYGALWFIPCIMLLYILTPLFENYINSVGKKWLYITSFLGFIWAMISAIVTDNYAPYSISVVIAFGMYYLVGGVLYSIKLSKKTVCVGVILSILLSIAALLLRCWGFDYYVFGPYRSYFSPAVVAMSISIFMIFKVGRIQEDKSNRLFISICSLIARYCLYIYLVHRLIVIILSKIFDYMWDNQFVIVKIIAVTVITTIVCLVIGVVWASLRRCIDEKIHLQNKIINMLNCIYAKIKN
ncbi:MAG: acyltransferase family protein [Bacteroides sp.]|nr:acyltransferase family protein [Bacteroides sp.]